MKIAVVNGPNMNLLGERETELYGRETLPSIEKKLVKVGAKKNMELLFFQSNHEGLIVDFIQENIENLNGIIINPAALTPNGYATLEALSIKKIPFIEVHITNIFARGGWHSKSIFSEKAQGIIVGMGSEGYILALEAFCILLEKES